MADECTKASRRRATIPAFRDEYITGAALDIGAGGDGLTKHLSLFPNLRSVREWDWPDGDAQYLASLPDNTFDCVHSSHCLEHMEDPFIALAHWVRVTKPGGYLVISIPDEDLYERGHWPSLYNADHKRTFTVWKDVGNAVGKSWSPVSVNVTDLIQWVAEYAEMVVLHTLADTVTHHPEHPTLDATNDPTSEPIIELVLRRRVPSTLTPVL